MILDTLVFDVIMIKRQKIPVIWINVKIPLKNYFKTKTYSFSLLRNNNIKKMKDERNKIYKIILLTGWDVFLVDLVGGVAGGEACGLLVGGTE